ncbi:hypothetical protein V8E53_004911 [Lactarius tabidus]
MSQVPPENIDMTEADIGPAGDDRQYPSRSAQNQAWRDESNFVDSSGPVFSMYMEMAEEEDKKMAESWKADAEGILVFTGLFSAAVASLISVSIQDIQQNPQDTSNFYLANIYQATIADPTRSNIPSSLPTSPPPFTPPTYAVWVNSLWFLSLVVSITCALLATLLQQWARRYLKVTQTRSSLHKRARIRSFFAEGVKKSHLSLVVEALPTLIHVSVSLFFAGLAVFLWNVNLTIFKVVLSWIGVCTAFYGCITFIPIFVRDSPYYSPLTPLARPVILAILLVLYILFIGFHLLVYSFSLCFDCRGSVRIVGHLFGRFDKFVDRVLLTLKEAVLKPTSEIDARAFTWTFDSLDEDQELDRFFAGMPGFHNSRVLKQPLHGLDDQQKLRLLEAVIRLLDRTLSSNLLSDKVKRKRADICAKAIEVVETPDAFPQIVRRLASEDGYGPVQSTQIADVVRRLADRKGEYSTLDQDIFSVVVARVQQHDDAWFLVASNELGVPEAILRSHAAHGDNLSFAILIYVTRQQFSHIRNPAWPSKAILDVLSAASKFNVQDTSPELQHEFCALWSQVVRQSQNDTDWKIPSHILKPIRHVYVQLHHGTNSAPTMFAASTGDEDDILEEPDSYPMCNVTGHVHDGSTSITFPRPVPRDDAVLSPVHLTSLDAPSFPVPVSFRVDGSSTILPPLDSSFPTCRTVDNLPVPVTSTDLASAGAMRDIVTTSTTTLDPTPETSALTSTFTSPLSSASQPAGVSLQHNANLLAPSDQPKLSTSNPSTAVLDNISHTATTAPSSLGITSEADPAATPDNDGSPNPGFREANDAPAVNRATRTDTTNTLDPQSPSPPSVPDSNRAIAGHSLREVNAENTGDRSLHPSRHQYDIV